MKMYWRIIMVLIWGFIIGTVMATKGFDPQPAYQILSLWGKFKVMSFISALIYLGYLAGEESKRIK